MGRTPSGLPRIALVGCLLSLLAVACAGAAPSVHVGAVQIGATREAAQQSTGQVADGLGPRGNLGAVWAIAEDDVWAVGASSLNADQQRPLVEHWDGSKWRRHIP